MKKGKENSKLIENILKNGKIVPVSNKNLRYPIIIYI